MHDIFGAEFVGLFLPRKGLLVNAVDLKLYNFFTNT